MSPGILEKVTAQKGNRVCFSKLQTCNTTLHMNTPKPFTTLLVLLSLTLLTISLTSGCTSSQGTPAVQGDYLVSPLPAKITPSEGNFILHPGTPIYRSLDEDDPLMECASSLLQAHIGRVLGWEPPVKTVRKTPSGGGIVLHLDPGLGEELEQFRQQECYRMSVGREGISITGATPAGVMHGVQTLLKSLPTSVTGGEKVSASLPWVTIYDYPQFPYRAFMLDCGRHFFPISTIKEVLDILALHGINYFHWHLSEDQGWRLEIKKYPRLTEVGSYRPGSPVPGKEGEIDNIPVSGFYTQDEARDVVAYAKIRGITVIPEIDLPGHMQAALASYPELGCTGGPYEVACRYGVLDDVLCPGKEGTLDFVRDVLEEVMDIFPSPYIHLGGDECPKVRWRECPHCQAKIRELGIKASGAKSAEDLLQSHFMAEAEKVLASKGRKMIGWNDILSGWDNVVSGEPTKSTVIASWMRPQSAAIAASLGYKTIMCPVGHLYFSNAERNALRGEESIRTVYDLEVVPEGLDEEQAKNVIGVEACIWSERVADREKLLWELLPRISALAELGWSSGKDYGAYLPRLRKMTRLYTSMGLNWKEDIAEAWENTSDSSL